MNLYLGDYTAFFMTTGLFRPASIGAVLCWTDIPSASVEETNVKSPFVGEKCMFSFILLTYTMNCHLNNPGSVTDAVIYHIPSVNYRILFYSSASTVERKQEVQGKMGKKTRLVMHSRGDIKLGHRSCHLENTTQQRHRHSF